MPANTPDSWLAKVPSMPETCPCCETKLSSITEPQPCLFCGWNLEHAPLDNNTEMSPELTQARAKFAKHWTMRASSMFAVAVVLFLTSILKNTHTWHAWAFSGAAANSAILYCFRMHRYGWKARYTAWGIGIISLLILTEDLTQLAKFFGYT